MNSPILHLKKLIKHNTISFIMAFLAVFSAQAQENQQGYIIDDLSIFMHAGPGTNYRILGSINAGAQLKTTGNTSNDYSEIIDDKDRVTWVETKYITRQPGLSFVVTDIKEKLVNGNDYTAQLDGEVNELKSSIDLINEEKNQLQTELKQVKTELVKTQNKLKGQDTAIKKEWFFNGAIVLGLGLILGLVLPKLFTRRRASMDNWG
ncbi:TIGR04211 family SH3 domain-containing protein [Colwellia sp. 20A7]|uniref:TIGR04211 family SH3 domain-containing protein n=1 Tax=Colwellia sp. 20A7 TaxID=2689569 RepID=UPI001F4603B6|nr:TIGR04211 family SH3 domain-containing protein [Colwellia sp. 20A7]